MKMSFIKRLMALALIIVSVFAVTSIAHAEYNTMYVNCDEGETVRLRATASTSGTILVNIPRGTAVQAEYYNSTWHRVNYGSYSGFMMSSFLSPNPVNLSTMYVTCTPGQTVRLREEPNTSADVLTNIPNGTEVEAASYNSDWYMVQYNGYTGYMMSDFLTYTEYTERPENATQAFGTGVIERGDTGNAVRNVQWCLVDDGWLSEEDVDGVFGSDTQAAVKSFQREHKTEYNLAIDGVVGPATMNALWQECSSILAEHGVKVAE